MKKSILFFLFLTPVSLLAQPTGTIPLNTATPEQIKAGNILIMEREDANNKPDFTFYLYEYFNQRYFVSTIHPTRREKQLKTI